MTHGIFNLKKILSYTSPMRLTQNTAATRKTPCKFKCISNKLLSVVNMLIYWPSFYRIIFLRHSHLFHFSLVWTQNISFYFPVFVVNNKITLLAWLKPVDRMKRRQSSISWRNSSICFAIKYTNENSSTATQ